MEIRRFGVGQRRPDGPAGTRGVQGQVIHSDARGVVSELAFARDAVVEPHTNPNTTWFVVIEGGGWVQVGDERARVAAGEAVLWPAHVVHGAWTDLSGMRAIVVELAGADDADARGIIDGRALLLASGSATGGSAPGGSAPGGSAPGGSAPGGSPADDPDVDRSGPTPGEGGLAPRTDVDPALHDRSSGEPY